MGFSSGAGKPTDTKDKVEFSDILFLHIDRCAKCAVENPAMFPVAVDVLAALVSFMGKVDYEANPFDTAEQRYLKTVSALEDVIKLLNDKKLLFKYRIVGKMGNVKSDEEAEN